MHYSKLMCLHVTVSLSSTSRMPKLKSTKLTSELTSWILRMFSLVLDAQPKQEKSLTSSIIESFEPLMCLHF